MRTWKTPVFRIAAAVLVAMLVFGCGQAAEAGGGGALAGEQSTTGVSSLPIVGTGESLPRVITVSGSGTATAQPDVVYVDLGVDTVENDAGVAVSQNTERMAAVMEVLSGFQIEAKDIRTVTYSMWVEQVYDKDGQPTGETRYHVTNQVRVTLRDLEKAGQLLEQTLAAGANTVGSVSFGVADTTALQRQARDNAIADAKARAEQLAAGFGAQLGRLRQVSEYSGTGGIVTDVRSGIGGGGGGVPISSGDFSVTVELQVIFELAE